MRFVSDSRILNPMQDFFRRIDGLQNIEIFDGNHFLTQQRVANPVQQTLPVIPSDQDHRKWL